MFLTAEQLEVLANVKLVCGWGIQTRKEAICTTAVHSCLHQERTPHQASSLNICPDVRKTWKGLQKDNLIAISINETLKYYVPHVLLCFHFIEIIYHGISFEICVFLDDVNI